MMNSELSFLVYINDAPFCIVYGSEQDASDFCNRNGAKYEPIVTVTVRYGLERATERGA